MALEGWELLLTGVGIVGSTVTINRIMLNSAVKSIKDHCQERQSFCAKWFSGSEEDRKDLWDRLNKHGHKGLNENGSKVTV